LVSQPSERNSTVLIDVANLQAMVACLLRLWAVLEGVCLAATVHALHLRIILWCGGRVSRVVGIESNVTAWVRVVSLVPLGIDIPQSCKSLHSVSPSGWCRSSVSCLLIEGLVLLIIDHHGEHQRWLAGPSLPHR
jgi:hypothetical protein